MSGSLEPSMRKELMMAETLRYVPHVSMCGPEARRVLAPDVAHRCDAEIVQMLLLGSGSLLLGHFKRGGWHLDYCVRPSELLELPYAPDPVRDVLHENICRIWGRGYEMICCDGNEALPMLWRKKARKPAWIVHQHSEVIMQDVGVTRSPRVLIYADELHSAEEVRRLAYTARLYNMRPSGVVGLVRRSDLSREAIAEAGNVPLRCVFSFLVLNDKRMTPDECDSCGVGVQAIRVPEEMV